MKQNAKVLEEALSLSLTGDVSGLHIPSLTRFTEEFPINISYFWEITLH